MAQPVTPSPSTSPGQARRGVSQSVRGQRCHPRASPPPSHAGENPAALSFCLGHFGTFHSYDPPRAGEAHRRCSPGRCAVTDQRTRRGDDCGRGACHTWGTPALAGVSHSRHGSLPLLRPPSLGLLPHHHRGEIGRQHSEDRYPSYQERDSHGNFPESVAGEMSP